MFVTKKARQAAERMIKCLQVEVKWLRVITNALSIGTIWIPEDSSVSVLDTTLMLTCSKCGLDLGPRMEPGWGKEE